MIRRALLALAWLAQPVWAEEVASVPYADLLPELTERVDFERLPQRPEPSWQCVGASRCH